VSWPPGRGPVTRFGGNPATEAEAVRALIATTERAQQRVEAQLGVLSRRLAADPEDLGLAFRTVRTRALVAEVTAVQVELLTSARAFAYRELPTLYAQGAHQLLAEVGVPHARLGWTTTDHRALSVIVRDTFSDLASATELMGEQAKRAIREAGKAVQGVRTITGSTLDQARRAMSRSLREGGVTAFIDRAGHRWTLDSYTAMVVRTKSAQAHNTGRVLAGEAAGVDRYYIIDGVNDELCAEANGSSCDGGWAVSNPLSHPNCRRVFAPDPLGSGALDYSSGSSPSQLYARAPIDPEVADELDAIP
jgi:hypothetical protein